MAGWIRADPRMSLRTRRFYSSALGHLVRHKNAIEVLGPGSTTLKEPISLAQRHEALVKVESTFLYDQLKRRERQRVFHTLTNDDARKFPMKLGYRTIHVVLTSRTYQLITAQDLRTIVWSGTSKDEVQMSIGILLQAARTPAAKNIVTPQLLSAVIRQAAEVGDYDKVYRRLTILHPKDFGTLLTPQFYAECLKLHVVRIPFLPTHYVKSFNAMYSKARPAGLAADLAFAYGLAAAAQKYGPKKAHPLPSVLDRVAERLRNGDEEVEVSDYVLGLEAARIVGELSQTSEALARFHDLEEHLEGILEKFDLPLTTLLRVALK